MRRQLSAAGGRGFVVGLGGGIDSAVVVRLAQLAAPGSVLGVLLPCHSNAQDEQDALHLASHFSLMTTRVDLSASCDALAGAAEVALNTILHVRDGTPPDPLRGRVALANLTPRLRMTMIYYLANSLNYLVAGTGNKSQLAIGYFTKYGDGGVDLMPLGNLAKSEVVALARDLNIPAEIIDRKPRAGPLAGRHDEEEMGFTYAELERYLDDGPQGVSPALAMRIERLVRANEHKRHLPPMPEDD